MIKRLSKMAIRLAAITIAVALLPGMARADKRVALVIGNSAYQNVPKLPNPEGDANAVAQMFKNAGFNSVDVLINAGNLELKRGIRRFEESADQADIAVVFYAGHGIEISGNNYLIPVDAKLASDRDADDEAIALDRLVSSADSAKRLRLIILDACRNNPFVGKMKRERSRTASRGVSSGLGKVEPTETDTLIAYAARAGSTADDGDGAHSPFTTAILRDLPVPGLDVRLAFGRVRDEVMKLTANRQEPFVYGSLGGGNVALVAAPAKPQESPVSDIKADFELVQKIGTQRALEVFLGTHPSGFYADLARAQIDALGKTTSVPTASSGSVVASLEPTQAPRTSSSTEALEWSKIKESTDIFVLQKFIKRFPDAPLAITAQQRIELLNRLAQERDEAKRKAAVQAAEEAAQRKRQDDERRAAALEAAEKAKAAAIEAAARKRREEDEKRAVAAEAERQAKQAEADRKAKQAHEKAEQAEREQAAREAAAAAAAAQKQAAEAELARKKAELAAQTEAICKDEGRKFDAIVQNGSDGTGIDDLKQFIKTIACDRLRSVAVVSLERFNTEAAKRAAEAPNALPLVRAAQTELIRLGCFTGRPDGSLHSTQVALGRLNKSDSQPKENIAVTKELVSSLSKQAAPACSIECGAGETIKNGVCIAEEKVTPPKPPATASNKNRDDTKPAARRKEAVRERSEPSRAQARQSEPRARQQAQARPASSGGGSHTMIGVGF